MIKKIALVTVAIMLLVFSASMSHANIIDGMYSFPDGTFPTQSSINPGGLGDSLLYGYYNVRSNNLNLFNIVNTSDTDGAKVRVVFRSAKTSKEVLDFSVCLSKGDVWTAYLLDDGTKGHIYVFDTDTITAPIFADQAFISGTYGPITVSADDTKEGYFEVIGLATIPTYDKATCTANAVTCPKTEALCRDFTSSTSVDNVLMGNNAIIDLSNLATYSYNATAIADFSTLPVALSAGQEPSMADMDGGCAEADFIFTKSNIISPYDLLTIIGGETEVILTFPTRKACHEAVTTTDMFNSTKTSASIRTEYCTGFGLSVWSDKEESQDVTFFSPSPSQCFPYEVNVLKIGGSNIWNSTVALSASTSYELGWVNIDLFNADLLHNSIGGALVSSNGLPSVAYTTQSFGAGEASYMTPAAYKTDYSFLVP